jgi:hypothetical protein
MDLDANIEDIEFPVEEQRLREGREVVAKLVTQEPIIFEEESMTFHNALFDKGLKKLVFEKINARNKKFQGKASSTLDLNGVPPSRIMHIHESIDDALKMLAGEMESENAIVKDMIRELEIALMPPPIFVIPIATMQSWKTLDGMLDSRSKLRGTSILLVAVRRCVGENIKKRILRHGN